MKNLQTILEKIKNFQRKFYFNELIRGVILFLSFGVVYFFITLFIESWLWLDSLKRWILFGVFLFIEFILFYKFIGIPLFKLMGIYKGISLEEGARFIGKYFPEIDDKLLNIIQLNSVSSDSEMVIACIDQRAKDLQPIPFLRAINFKSNFKYLKYLVPIICILLGILLTNSGAIFSNSLKRVVNPSVAFIKPAPFYFHVLNSELSSFENNDFKLQVTTIGELVPNDMQIIIDGNSFLLKQVGTNLFEYTFINISKSVGFSLEANAIVSEDFLLNCLKVPTLESMEVVLNFPKYINRKKETISNIGQLTVPRGTTIKWFVSGKNAKEVLFKIDSNQTAFSFSKLEEGSFEFLKNITRSFQYAISSQNQNIKNFEPLSFGVRCVADEYPSIKVEKYDDVNLKGLNRFLIDVSDDYLVSDVLLCFSAVNDANTLVKRSILRPKKQFHNFIYTLSDSINFIDGVNYECYFEVWDNDGILGPKSAKSEIFSFYKKTIAELNAEHLSKEKNEIKDLESERLAQQLLKKELEDFKNKINAKKDFNFKDKTNFEQFLLQQKKHEAILNRKKEYLLNTISESKVQKSLNEKKADLEKRLKESLELNKRNKLLEELKELAKKLNKDDLVKKLEKLSSQNKQKERSLERLVEMTKRFYVEQKALKIKDELEALSKKQEALSKKLDSLNEQKKLIKDFDDLQKELDDLRKDNEDLKNPMNIPDTEKEEESIEMEMMKASEKLAQKKSPNQHQKKAANEMMKMAMKMESKMQSGEMEMMDEDLEALRSIVENLINFSFQQEALIVAMEGLQIDAPTLVENVKKQHQLKKYFEHIDDSLYVLSLRMEKMSSTIEKELSDAHYFLGNSIDYFSEIKFRDGIKSQQYVMTAVNNLAVMLSDLLDSMMNAMAMPGSGKGKGEGFSLPDIIKKQSDLLDGMKEGIKPGEKGLPNNGNSGGEGEEGEAGDLYKMYQEQSRIKEMFDALNKSKEGANSGKEVSKQMEQLLMDLISHGFTKSNVEKMNSLKYELLKLKEAFKEQGQKEERKSKENILKFSKSRLDSLLLQKYFKTKDELLLRQSLPLQHDYKIKVNNYFKTN